MYKRETVIFSREVHVCMFTSIKCNVETLCTYLDSSWVWLSVWYKCGECGEMYVCIHRYVHYSTCVGICTHLAYTNMYFSTHSIHIHCYILHRYTCICYCTHNSYLSLPSFIQHITLPPKIHWQCVLCRHEITSQKFFKGRTGAQTSEGSRVEPKLIHYMCCICLPLKSPEHSGCLSRSLFLTLWLQTTFRLLA